MALNVNVLVVLSSALLFAKMSHAASSSTAPTTTTTKASTTAEITTETATTMAPCGSGEERDLTGECVCQTDHFDNNGTCLPCTDVASNCTTCKAGTPNPVCVTCDETLLLHDNTCVSNCPPGYKPDNMTTCEKVNVNRCNPTDGDLWAVCVFVPIVGVLVIAGIVVGVLFVLRKKKEKENMRRNLQRRPSMPHPFEDEMNGNDVPRSEPTSPTGRKQSIMPDPFADQRKPKPDTHDVELQQRYEPGRTRPTPAIPTPAIPTHAEEPQEVYQNVDVNVRTSDPKPKHRKSNSDDDPQEDYENVEQEIQERMKKMSDQPERMRKMSDQSENKPPAKRRPSGNLHVLVDPPPPNPEGHTVKHGYVNLPNLKDGAQSPGAKSHDYINMPKQGENRNSGPKRKMSQPRPNTMIQGSDNPGYDPTGEETYENY